MFRRSPSSLRARLALWYLLILGLVLANFGAQSSRVGRIAVPFHAGPAMRALSTLVTYSPADTDQGGGMLALAEAGNGPGPGHRGQTGVCPNSPISYLSHSNTGLVCRRYTELARRIRRQRRLRRRGDARGCMARAGPHVATDELRMPGSECPRCGGLVVDGQ
jgi:hypothetical protein